MFDFRKSITRRYAGVFNVQDRIRSTFSPCGTLVFSGSEDRQVHCWHTYNGNLLYSYQSLNYIQPVISVEFHPFDNIIAMCSIGPAQQVFVFHHTFSDADYEAKPLKPSAMSRTNPSTMSDSGYRPSGPPPPAPTRTGRTDSGSEDIPTSSTSRTDHRNRRLAVVNKMLDDMDEIIVRREKNKEKNSNISLFFSIFRFRNQHVNVVENRSANTPAVIQLVEQRIVMLHRTRVVDPT